ncbi:MAG: hypothetical protein AUH25_06565 [Thaumarchaeota archaeon 13_1_40CM_38_12]|nr:MAG: hypothetical protein AUH25_06565 [Thaumarchaeota archaeon 13_1_40CM_38_12]OLC93914.1 MAG: hypothetical protein AUI92_01840 [Thaumarchaeota archaeon 13_1_40CM_3_38_6]OLD41219.1 MAG: hypothetical protein AUI60_02510 [Thaumarchaeota archaeon 13_1_40CM_2_39_4]TLY07023.1 MAG: hypothetical protein E6K83_06920 [Nitrososphaerota archaeon]
MEIIIEPWKELVIHEVLELKLDEWVTQIIASARSAGGGIPTIFWAGGLAFHFATFPDTETIVQEKLKGRIHYSSVTFAIKEKFEKQVVREGGTVNFTDVSHNEIFSKLADKLSSQSKFK